VKTASRLTEDRLLCNIMNMKRGIMRRKDYCIAYRQKWATSDSLAILCALQMYFRLD